MTVAGALRVRALRNSVRESARAPRPPVRLQVSSLRSRLSEAQRGAEAQAARAAEAEAGLSAERTAR
jgi:hypothetical protein